MRKFLIVLMILLMGCATTMAEGPKPVPVPMDAPLRVEIDKDTVWKWGTWKNDSALKIYLIVRSFDKKIIFWQGGLMPKFMTPPFQTPEGTIFKYYWICMRCYFGKGGTIAFRGDHPRFRTKATMLPMHNCTSMGNNKEKRWGCKNEREDGKAQPKES